MQNLIDTLPGRPISVADVPAALARSWQPELGEANQSPTEFHASQMNLILHYGLKTTEKEAKARFETCLQFAQRHPCRIIVLCPKERNCEKTLLRSKLFTQCFTGRGRDEKVCCEALMLGYSTSESNFLENQVSIWLDSDLPTYHWFHRVPAHIISEHYLTFVKDFKRIIYDASIEKENFAQINWVRPEALRDLAVARTISLRQSIGQFLSTFEPRILVEDLVRIEMGVSPGRSGEAYALLSWQSSCLEGCAQRAGIDVSKLKKDVHKNPENESTTLSSLWHYKGEKSFGWQFREEIRSANLAADFGSGPVSYPAHIKRYAEDESLAEALFS